VLQFVTGGVLGSVSVTGRSERLNAAILVFGEFKERK
jgi:hypothetical protein